MHNSRDIIFAAGGLHFIYVREAVAVFLILPGLSLYEFARTFCLSNHTMPVEKLSGERIGVVLNAQFTTYWAWEVRIQKRNRWDELKARGGAVPVYWSNFNPYNM